MHIAIADNNGGKFTKDIQDHWISKGHDVKFERGASEYLAQWADLYYVDTWDNNLHYLYKLYHGVDGVSRTPNWDNKKKPKIVVRALDWEVWIGMARDQKIIDWVDTVICIAPHIEKELRKHGNFGDKLHVIKPGVNLDRFTLKTKETDGKQIGMVLGDMWWMKNHMAGLDIFTTLIKRDHRWRLHIRGQHEGGNEYWKTMYEYYLKSRGIEEVVTLYPQVEDMNEWYEEIDYLLHPGMKEAYCYAIGESMAKGIKPVVNNFYGSADIWNPEIIYNTHNQAINMFYSSYAKRPEMAYREYIQEYHNVKDMLRRYDERLGT